MRRPTSKLFSPFEDKFWNNLFSFRFLSWPNCPIRIKECFFFYTFRAWWASSLVMNIYLDLIMIFLRNFQGFLIFSLKDGSLRTWNISHFIYIKSLLIWTMAILRRILFDLQGSVSFFYIQIRCLDNSELFIRFIFKNT
jgi:hypothetical protein